MSDNIVAPASGMSFATDEIGAVHYPRTKISHGVDGSAVDASSANPLPVIDAAVQAAIARLGTYRRYTTITAGTGAQPEPMDGILVTVAGSVTLKYSASATAVTIAADANTLIPLYATHVTAAPSGTLALFYS